MELSRRVDGLLRLKKTEADKKDGAEKKKAESARAKASAGSDAPDLAALMGLKNVPAEPAAEPALSQGNGEGGGDEGFHRFFLSVLAPERN